MRSAARKYGIIHTVRKPTNTNRSNDMRNGKLAHVLALGACILFGCGEAVAGYISTQKAVVPGVWTSDYDGALEYTEKNNIPMLVFWANAGCSHCEGIEREMNKEPFLTWMAENKLVMVFSESDSKVKKWIKQYAKTKIKDFPYMAIYWPENTLGVTVLEGFSAYKGNMSLYGASSRDSNIKQIMDTVAFLLPDWDPSGSVTPTDPVYYTVTFVVDANKGTATGSLSQSVESGKGATAPTVVAKDGWKFDGWDTSFSKVSANLTVTAKFSSTTVQPEPDPVYYTVTFVVDEEKGTATGSLSQSVESGKSATAPTVQAKEGWEFDGWDKSFSKVTADMTVTAKFVEPVERDEVDPAKFFKKAKKLEAVAYDGGDLFGKAAITLGKYNAKKGYLKASFKITSFGGKLYSKSIKVVPNEFGDILDVDVTFKSPIKTMTFDLVNNNGEYDIIGEGDEYSVETGTVVIGGALENDEMFFSASFDDLEPENDDYYFVVDVPMGAVATVKNGKSLSFGSSPKIKYVQYKEDGYRWYELAEYDEERYPNANAVKLTYKPATGAFSGSFKIYASNEMSVDEGKKPTLKTYTAKFSGYVVDGVGVGTVSVKVGRKTYTGVCSLD